MVLDQDVSPPAYGSWPAHDSRTVPWQQTTRGGAREDRMLREINVSLPPMIAELDVHLDPTLTADMESAVREITILDRSHAEDLTALTRLLLRTESVASSKIEEIEASVTDYARALHGNKSNASAVSMVAATRALENMVNGVGTNQAITIVAITDAHEALMAEDAYEASYAGRIRDVQNWIGGSDHSPRGALYVPPPAPIVNAYMADLVTYSNRTDLPVLAQAAIAHAQFESIHPFTDGNGRIGRALINTILRRRGTTSNVVVPIASVLVSKKGTYFDLLADYRRGEVQPIITAFTKASVTAAQESQVTANRLAQTPEGWRLQLGTVRSGSATSKLLELITHNPVLTAQDAASLIDAPQSSVYSAIARLTEAKILVPLTHRVRDQVFGAQAILDELDDLSVRIAIASRD